ncbi:uncharacterized protein SCDLUD_001605 [Saccharomycodes ludwigii]|uniref:uncharacterized protein n=1 Tax=Saccharomycodes ludwigii TaxID=36035 RepID=UPI001E82A2E7|nr:hypothetical protein SCDLUD_001605 [Saccharomycodes ludwigii]KAH3901822.1 hypothetical protein SCDLUD_001605 [Saccharomycodes ludwigii]
MDKDHSTSADTAALVSEEKVNNNNNNLDSFSAFNQFINDKVSNRKNKRDREELLEDYQEEGKKRTKYNDNIILKDKIPCSCIKKCENRVNNTNDTNMETFNYTYTDHYTYADNFCSCNQNVTNNRFYTPNEISTEKKNQWEDIIQENMTTFFKDIFESSKFSAFCGQAKYNTDINTTPPNSFPSTLDIRNRNSVDLGSLSTLTASINTAVTPLVSSYATSLEMVKNSLREYNRDLESLSQNIFSGADNSNQSTKGCLYSSSPLSSSSFCSLLKQQNFPLYQQYCYSTNSNRTGNYNIRSRSYSAKNSNNNSTAYCYDYDYYNKIYGNNFTGNENSNCFQYLYQGYVPPAPATTVIETTNNIPKSTTTFVENAPKVEPKNFIEKTCNGNVSFTNNFNSKKTPSIWSQKISNILYEGLSLIPMDSKSRTLITGKFYGRNELISLYILFKSNGSEYRSPKQISSHLQVLKKQLTKRISFYSTALESMVGNSSGTNQLTRQTLIDILAYETSLLKMILEGAVDSIEKKKQFQEIFETLLSNSELTGIIKQHT